MKILVTGGAGYIGNELVYRLAAADNVDQITVYDNLTNGNYNLFLGSRKLANPAAITFVQGDILDTHKLRKLIDQADLIYHLAATVRSAPYADQDSHKFEQNNHWGTAELAYAIEECGPKRVAHVSTLSVYGSGRVITSVDDPLNPESYYGISKLRGEKHMQRLADKMPVYVVRCANVYGYSKNLRTEAAINRMLFDAHFHNRLQIQGSGDQVRGFVSISRVVDCLYQLADTQLSPGTYNLVDKSLSIIEVADTLKQIYPELEMIFVDQHMPMRDIRAEPDPRLSAILACPEQSLLDDLLAFRKMFTF